MSQADSIDASADLRTFGEDCVLPEEYAGAPLTGCRALLQAIFHQVFHTRKRFPSSKQAAKDAEWVRSDATTPLTFHWYCGLLGLDPAVTRKAYLSIPTARP
jgi:hypothetical protein